MMAGAGSRSSPLDRRRVLTGVVAAAAAPSSWWAAAAGAASVQASPDPRLARAFVEAGAEGVICIGRSAPPRAGDLDVAASDPVRAAARYTPASTFKIVNALIGLDAGLVRPDETFVWDGTERGFSGKPWPAWNKSQTLAEAFRNSTVWVYQELARRIGPELMARRVSEFGYGNADIGGVPVDQFWLSGNLRISAIEQVDFLSRLWRGELGVQQSSRAALRDIMRVEETPRGTLYGKTGWAFDQRIGWFVGVIESGGEAHPFALNLDMDAEGKLAPTRIAIVRAIAADRGWL